MTEVITVTVNPALDVTMEAAEMVPERKLRSRTVAAEPGGGGINVARALITLEHAVEAVVPVGGQAGTEVELLLRRESIPLRVVPISGTTRRSITIQTTKTHEHYRLVGNGPDLNPSEVGAVLNAVYGTGEPVKFVVLSGSLSAGMGRTFIEDLATVARELKAELVADTSGEALEAAVESGVFLIKPNRAELTTLAGLEGDEIDFSAISDACRKVQERGAQNIVASLGAAGAYARSRDGKEARFYAPFVDTVSSVGAGDSMLGGIIAGLLRRKSFLEAVRLGVACGAGTCMMPGTQLFRARDLPRLVAETAKIVPSTERGFDFLTDDDEGDEGDVGDDGPAASGKARASAKKPATKKAPARKPAIKKTAASN
jgi:6-phosphofructokinase 2